MERIVYIYNHKPCEIDKNEVLRYANAVADEQTLSLLNECINEAVDILSYKICYTKFTIERSGDELDLGFAKISSHSLSLCLDGCDEIILFAATVGSAFDRLIAKYNVISPSKAVLLQALGSERVESLCDEFCRDMAYREADCGRTLRPRYSPGYGDLPIEIQEAVFSALDCTKNIGVSLSDSLFMMPSKSVTAIIGIYNK